LDRLPPSSVPKIEIDRALIEIAQLAMAPCAPGQQAADDVEASPRAVSNKPFFNETYGIALDKLPMRPTPETPEQLASAQVLINVHLLVLRC
jgi:hypothetical protein